MNGSCEWWPELDHDGRIGPSNIVVDYAHDELILCSTIPTIALGKI